MHLFIERTNRKMEKKFRGNVRQLLRKLKLNPETVLVAKNNALVTEDEKLDNTDDVKILSVISGG
jgi:sulfur carrier protein ThiS